MQLANPPSLLLFWAEYAGLVASLGSAAAGEALTCPSPHYAVHHGARYLMSASKSRKLEKMKVPVPGSGEPG